MNCYIIDGKIALVHILFKISSFEVHTLPVYIGQQRRTPRRIPCAVTVRQAAKDACCVRGKELERYENWFLGTRGHRGHRNRGVQKEEGGITDGGLPAYEKRSRPRAGTFFVRTAKESRLPGSLRGEKERSRAVPSGSGPDLRDRPQCPKGKRRLLCKRYAVVQSHT